MEILIFIAVLAVIVAISVIANKESKTCPKCGQWRTTETGRLDSKNMLLENPNPGQKTVINLYRCNNCGNRWEKRVYESTD
jgi:predicted RNA-binding Zn-ribbon protein involved in translation (DUF1610 family)